jgi:hypothetical protein
VIKCTRRAAAAAPRAAVVRAHACTGDAALPHGPSGGGLEE